MMDEREAAQNEHMEPADEARTLAIRGIAQRLAERPQNPVIRARAWVEREVPVAQRGPGWDRHWRELEHYAASAGIWSGTPHEDDDEE